MNETFFGTVIFWLPQIFCFGLAIHLRRKGRVSAKKSYYILYAGWLSLVIFTAGAFLISLIPPLGLLLCLPTIIGRLILPLIKPVMDES